jgi:hypothetical protein
MKDKKLKIIITLALCLAFLAPASTTFAAAAYVNSSICGSAGTSVSTQTCSLSVTAGNQLFVTIFSSSNAPTFTMQGDGVNTYTAIAGSAGGHMKSWLVSSLATTATVTVTINLSVAVQATINMEQVSGATGTVDVSHLDNQNITGTAAAGTKSYNCTAVTTLTPNAYVYAVGGQNNGNSNVTTMTMTNISVNDTGSSQTGVGNRVAFGHQTTTSTVTVTPTFNATPDTNASTSSASCFIVAIKAAAVATRAPRHRVTNN